MQLIAIMGLGVVFCLYYRSWIVPILKHRWSFYPEEIGWGLGYAIAITITDFVAGHFTWIDVVVNVVSATIATFILRQLTWTDIQDEKD